MATEDSRERSVELWDLSRVHDRLGEIRRELEDIAVTKIGNERDEALFTACGEAEGAVNVPLTHVEERLGDPANYQPEDDR